MINPSTNNFNPRKRGSIRPLKRYSFRIKSQAIAFLLGFALTSVVLLLIPGISKTTSQARNAGDHKLTGFVSTQNTADGDSTVVTNGHFNTNPVPVNP